MKTSILFAAALLAAPAALAAEPAAPANAAHTSSCLQLATAMSLQGDAQRRFVEECVRAKENVNRTAPPPGPFEATPAC